MKIHLLKDNNGNYFGYERGQEMRSFSPYNSLLISWSEDEEAWVHEMAEALNARPLECIHALPITIVTVEIP
jgi:hypothetical protein